MTFFIQNCPRCARRFEVHMRALGQKVECRFCYSTFDSFDSSGDSGEASDRIDQWAREQDLEEDSVEEEDSAIHRPK